eukprot:CAMPEP_0174300574 /NCGR_PEP_ID=MMETSP0809-20121228/58537_1 /TAXON_ID=73025 ORGANISM="Eutreptiella gymnastica-like, Strain CCMP1594" /NCGR_SAMPLE_ID=MMETSP0809 /ASSEMBLY_ACC=CAM_ASM_000658 /LENGTH=43 /DNA_ID= /DNA_START= /DNA_END= /DNA_ORIENTATION=
MWPGVIAFWCPPRSVPKSEGQEGRLTPEVPCGQGSLPSGGVLS